MKNKWGTGIITAVCVLMLIELTGCSPKEVCIRAGCYRDRASGSIYCDLHRPSSYSSSRSSSYNSGSSGSSSYKSNTSGSSSGSSSKKNGTNSSKPYSYKKNSTSSSSKSKSSYSGGWNSYDAGYDDVYDNDDYDWDRYYSDSDYADGVDDAMDELDW